MQKVVAILEKNAEWIALGLAGLWVLWIAWAYGVNRPVSIPVDGAVCTPANIDQVIRDGPLAALERLLQNTKVPVFPSSIINGDDPLAAIKNTPVPPPLPFVAMLSIPAPKIEATTGPMPNAVLVAELPDVPAAKIQTPTYGRSQIVPPLPRVGAPGEDGMPRPVPAGVVPVTAIDKAWVTVSALFNVKQLEAEFTKAKIPDTLNKIVYLEVQLERQEVAADGTPVGDPALVPPLPINLPQFDRKLQSIQFLEWAEKNDIQQKILQPDFYQTVPGSDPWILPGKPVMDVAPVKVKPPAEIAADLGNALLTKLKTFKTPKEKQDFRMSLTPDDRRALTLAEDLEKQKEAAAKAKTKRPVTAKPTGTTRTPASTYDVQDPAMFNGVQLAAADEYVGAGAPRPGGGIGVRAVDDAAGIGRLGGARMGQFGPMGPTGLMPNAEGNIFIWAHDETAEPGRTYQYRIRLLVKNPVYQTTNVAKPGLESILELPVKPNWSEWSKPVGLAATLKIQVVSGSALGRDQVKVNVYRWLNGKNNKSPSPFAVSPGDTIGGMVNDVDYSTPWMVADVRQVGNDTRVTLVNDAGLTQVRFYKADSTSTEFKDPEPDPSAIKAAVDGMTPPPPAK